MATLAKKKQEKKGAGKDNKDTPKVNPIVKEEVKATDIVKVEPEVKEVKAVEVPTIIMKPISKIQHVLESGIMFNDSILEQAKYLVKSGLLPDSIKEPEQAVVVMQKGRELGFPAMASFEHIVVINNKPTLDGVAMITKLRQGGVEWETIKDYDLIYKIGGVKAYASELYERKEAVPGGVTMVNAETLIHFYRKSNIIKDKVIMEPGRFTFSEAKTAGLLTKDVWKKYLRSMLWWRAFALGARRIAGDLTMGMNTPEEVDTTGTIFMDSEGNVKTLKNI